jgi:hypothetical protein
MFIISNPPLLTYNYRIQVLFPGQNHHSARKHTPGKSHSQPKKNLSDLQERSPAQRVTHVPPNEYTKATGIDTGPPQQLKNDGKKSKFFWFFFFFCLLNALCDSTSLTPDLPHALLTHTPPSDRPATRANAHVVSFHCFLTF